MKYFFLTRKQFSLPLVIVLAVGSLGAPLLFHPSRAAALDSDTYPFSDATTLDATNYDWGYAPCPSKDPNCAPSTQFQYPFNGTVYGEADPELFFLRNCTSFVSQKIAQQFNGRSTQGWGQAINWHTNAANAGYTIENTPQVGDIANWGTSAGTYGHVAYVAAVNNGIATLDEYNWGSPGNYSNSRTVGPVGTSGAPDWYIHMGTPSGSSAPTSGPLYQFVNSGSGWNSYNITYTGGGKTYNIQGTPSVLWGSTVNVFGVGPDGQLLQYSLPSGGSWFPYTLSANNMLAGGVSAVQVGSTIEVFATGTNGHLYQFVNSGSGWNWYDITYSSGGTWYTVQGSPSVVWGSTVNVYAAGTNGELLQYSLPSGGSWFPYTLSANNTVTGGVSALQVGSTLIDFATATGGRLYQFVNSGSGWNWYDITYGAYTVQGGPSAIWGSTVNVFTIGNNAASGNVLQYSLPSGGSWFPWTINSPTALAGGMSAVMVGSTFQVFGD